MNRHEMHCGGHLVGDRPNAYLVARCRISICNSCKKNTMNFTMNPQSTHGALDVSEKGIRSVSSASRRILSVPPGEGVLWTPVASLSPQGAPPVGSTISTVLRRESLRRLAGAARWRPPAAEH